MASPYAKKRAKYRKERMRELAAVNNKYTQIFRQICGLQGDFLSYEEMRSPAYVYAANRAKEELEWYQSIFSGKPAELIISFVMLVVSIVLCFTPAAPAGAAGIGAVIAETTSIVVAEVVKVISMVAQVCTSLANVAMSAVAHHYGMKVEGLAGLAQGKSELANAYKRRELAEQQSNNLTALMIYGGYSIYAGGEVYNQNAAGSQTFNNQIPFDTTKGIRGDIQQESEISKMIHTRTGADLAGGENYMANILNLPFPLQKFSFGSTQIQDMLVNRYLIITRKLNDAFVELNNLDINADGNAQALYDRKFKELTTPTKTALYSDDFLDKIKNYSRGLMADFDYKDEKIFKKEKKRKKHGFCRRTIHKRL